MRIARVIGHVTLSRKIEALVPGTFLLVEALDESALRGGTEAGAPLGKRDKPMPESLVVFDELGAGVGQLIAVSEGAEATMPFYPKRVPLDAYNSAILDHVEITRTLPRTETRAPAGV
ncbi:MAG: EutN/CcmL family microcompartment protein [Planctomycetota bacterium]|nr:EutN/CcmL family microcompartment protein [Planctomycetota bacterium]